MNYLNFGENIKREECFDVRIFRDERPREY
jgi:hypothetical protein